MGALTHLAAFMAGGIVGVLAMAIARAARDEEHCDVADDAGDLGEGD